MSLLRPSELAEEPERSQEHYRADGHIDEEDPPPRGLRGEDATKQRAYGGAAGDD